MSSGLVNNSVTAAAVVKQNVSICSPNQERKLCMRQNEALKMRFITSCCDKGSSVIGYYSLLV